MSPHLAGLQCPVIVEGPKQGSPLIFGGGELQVLVLVPYPPPQLALQTQEPQLDQPPSRGLPSTSKKFIIIIKLKP